MGRLIRKYDPESDYNNKKNNKKPWDEVLKYYESLPSNINFIRAHQTFEINEL